MKRFVFTIMFLIGSVLSMGTALMAIKGFGYDHLDFVTMFNTNQFQFWLVILGGLSWGFVIPLIADIAFDNGYHEPKPRFRVLPTVAKSTVKRYNSNVVPLNPKPNKKKRRML